jgi:hypothetical protein
MALAALARPTPAGDPPEVVVAGPLSPSEGLTLAGRVEGGSGPIQVQLWRYEFEDTGRWYHRTDALAAVVPPGGRFRFTGLAPARYECEFGEQRYWFAGPHPDVYLLRDVEDHALRVPSNCRLAGHVKAAFPELKSTVNVSLGYFDARVAADGSFETPDVPPGDYRARIRESWLADPGPYRFDSIERSIPVRLGGGVTTIDVTLTPDVPLALAVRSSRAGETFEGRFGAESASVMWERGWFRSVADASGPTGMQRTVPGFPHGAACWEPAGSALHLDGFCVGRHRLRLTALGFEPWERGVDVGPRALVEAVMTALPGQFVEVANLPDVARVEIRPAGGAWREIAACDRRMTDMGADYEPPIVEFLAPGRYEWRADSLDGAPMPAAELVATEDRAVLKLAPAFAGGRTLRGRLRTKFGRGLGGARVRFAVRDGDAWRFVPTKDTPTDARTGAFETHGLSPGRWRAQLDDAGAVVLGEFDVADSDVSRDFTFVPR